MAELTYAVPLPHDATITISGEIALGDAERFEQLANRVWRQEHVEGNLLRITVNLDSPGGNYLEGLALGHTFRRLGCATRVQSQAECYSAAAFAFLGGAHLGAVGGWLPERTVEAGAKLGFHSFYSSAEDSIGIGEGIEHGKRLAMILADYATTLRVDMNFIIESLERGPDELLLLQTVEQFRNLKINVVGVPPVTEMTVERAIIAANYATNWRRPVSLHPRAGEALAIVERLTANEYRRNILKHLVSPEYCRGPVTDLIQSTLLANNPATIRQLYEDASRLDAAPFTSLSEGSTIFHVRGFEYGATFYVTDCYVIPSEKSPDLSLSVVVVRFQNNLETVRYSRAGDILYELHPPKTVLWSVD